MARNDKPTRPERLFVIHDVDGSRMGQVWALEEPTGQALDEWRLYLGIWARWARKRAELDERAALRTARVFEQSSLFETAVSS